MVYCNDSTYRVMLRPDDFIGMELPYPRAFSIVHRLSKLVEDLFLGHLHPMGEMSEFNTIMTDT